MLYLCQWHNARSKDLTSLSTISLTMNMMTQPRSWTLGCSLFLKSDLNFMDIKSWALFTELGGLVVDSWVFNIGNNTPRPTHFGGKRKSWDCFLKFWSFLHFILPSILIFYPIGQYYTSFNTSICIETYVGSIDFGVKMTNFAVTPEVSMAGGLSSKWEYHGLTIIACISVNEESRCNDTMSYRHFLRIKYHFSWNYFAVKSSKIQ